MCILLYVTLFWCTGIPYIYGQFEWGSISPKYMHIVLYGNVFGVMVIHTSMVN